MFQSSCYATRSESFLRLAAQACCRSAIGVVLTSNVRCAALVAGQTKEAETICRILSHLTRLLKLDANSLEAHAASLKVVCQEQRVDSPVLAKAVISLYVQVRIKK